jgi:hypothetical protein
MTANHGMHRIDPGPGDASSYAYEENPMKRKGR